MGGGDVQGQSQLLSCRTGYLPGSSPPPDSRSRLCADVPGCSLLLRGPGEEPIWRELAVRAYAVHLFLGVAAVPGLGPDRGERCVYRRGPSPDHQCAVGTGELRGRHPLFQGRSAAGPGDTAEPLDVCRTERIVLRALFRNLLRDRAIREADTVRQGGFRWAGR